MKPYKLKMCRSNNPTALNSVVDDNHTNEEMQVDIGLPEDPDLTETLYVLSATTQTKSRARQCTATDVAVAVAASKPVASERGRSRTDDRVSSQPEFTASSSRLKSKSKSKKQQKRCRKRFCIF